MSFHVVPSNIIPLSSDDMSSFSHPYPPIMGEGMSVPSILNISYTPNIGTASGEDRVLVNQVDYLFFDELAIQDISCL